MTRAEIMARAKRLLSRRDDVLRRMQELTRNPENENRKRTPSEEAEYQRLDAELCQLDQTLEAPANIVETSNIRGDRRYQERAFDPVRVGEAPSGGSWIDAKSGKPVRVLGPSEKLSTGEDIGFGIADVFRALALGPKTEAEMRAMDGTSVGSGAATIPTILGAQLIDALRAKSIAVGLGCRTVEMPNRTLNLARVVADPVAGYRAENDDVALADTTFDLVTLSAKNLSALIKISRELFEDSNLSQELPALISRVVAAAIDKGVFAGSGGGSPDSLEPLGILGQPGVNEVSGSGTVTSYDDVVDAITAILSNNGDMPTAMAFDPQTWGAFEKLKEGTTNAPLLPPGAVAGLRKGVTTALGSGTSPATGNVVIGGFSEVMLGIRTQLEITLLKERFADKGEYAWWLWTRYDVAIARPKNLARVVTIG